jgi:hypothetical protein
MPPAPSGPRFVGLLYADQVHVTPSGVWIYVAGGGSVLYAGDLAPNLRRPGVFGGFWYGFGILEPEPPVAQLITILIAAVLFWIAWLGATARRAQGRSVERHEHK